MKHFTLRVELLLEAKVFGTNENIIRLENRSLMKEFMNFEVRPYLSYANIARL